VRVDNYNPRTFPIGTVENGLISDTVNPFDLGLPIFLSAAKGLGVYIYAKELWKTFALCNAAFAIAVIAAFPHRGRDAYKRSRAAELSGCAGRSWCEDNSRGEKRGK
jgi:hypothetical protein